MQYLYGRREEEHGGETVSEAIVRHRWETKDIASDFFAQPDSEHISAVIANPSGTLAKFKRMGFLTGFGDRDRGSFAKERHFKANRFQRPSVLRLPQRVTTRRGARDSPYITIQKRRSPSCQRLFPTRAISRLRTVG